MHDVVFYAGMVWLAVLLGLIVAIGAPRTSTAGRILALDLVVLVLMGLLALVAGRDQRPYPLDAALALALLSFVATVAAARYYEDRRPYG